MTEVTPPRFREPGLHGSYELVGYGGEHLAYLHPYFAQLARESLTADGNDDPGVVAKLSCISIREGNTGAPGVDEPYLAEMLGALQQRQARIREIFGPDTVPWQDNRLRSVYLSREEITFVWGEESHTKEEGNFWAIETFQDTVPELLGQESIKPVGLGLAYAERLAVQAPPEVYGAVSTRWLQQSSRPPDSAEIAGFLKVHSNAEVERLLAHVTSDKLAAASLRHFISGCITYTRETDEVLDLVGANNVIFLSNGRYKIVDVLTTKRTPIAGLLPGILLKAQNREGLNAREMNRLVNGLGYLRFVNFMAAWLDLPERLEPLQGMTADGQLWPQVQKILNSSPRLNKLRQRTEPNAVHLSINA